MKRKYLLRFPHRQPSPCHRFPLGQIAEARAVGRHPESLQMPPPRGGGYFGDTGWLLCVKLSGYFREIPHDDRRRGMSRSPATRLPVRTVGTTRWEEEA